jgi:hypothetical protein
VTRDEGTTQKSSLGIERLRSDGFCRVALDFEDDQIGQNWGGAVGITETSRMVAFKVSV